MIIGALIVAALASLSVASGLELNSTVSQQGLHRHKPGHNWKRHRAHNGHHKRHLALAHRHKNSSKARHVGGSALLGQDEGHVGHRKRHEERQQMEFDEEASKYTSLEAESDAESDSEEFEVELPEPWTRVFHDFFSDIVSSDSDEDGEHGAVPPSDEYQYRKAWHTMKTARRHKHPRRLEPDSMSVSQFFQSTSFFEWSIFAGALVVFVPLYYCLLDWPSTTNFHAGALLIWLLVGMVYNALVWVRLGSSAGIMWFTGYLLEFIFSIENVFVFHIVATAFRTPRRVTQKALFVVVCCQIVFEMTFFMGLADRLRSMHVLPYILGFWLIYVGQHAAREDTHEEFKVQNSTLYRGCQTLLGRRFVAAYEPKGDLFVVNQGKLCFTLFLPLVFSLLAVDFCLEVDVTLTKIEELPNEYIAFTSSAAAAFAMPELFFVARDLFQRYGLLKYGVSFVLIFFGVQMLFHRLYDIPDLLGCGIIVVVMILCIIASDIRNRRGDQDKEPCIDGRTSRIKDIRRETCAA